jgi:hypothetical protein
MAEIIVTAFVQEWKRDSNEPNPDWGMKVVENHQKKEGDGWVTIGRTYFTVKAGWEVKIDFRIFKKGDRVKIVGKQVTESRTVDGKTYNTLTIKADTVELVQSGRSEAVAQRAFATGDEPF